MAKVQLMVTCMIDALAPEVGDSVVTVLERAGAQIEVPRGQTCCGQPAFNGGFWDEARGMAKHTIRTLGKRDLPVVIPSGSCADMIIHHYPELFADDPVWLGRARELAERTYEFTQYLVDVLGVTDLGAGCPTRLTYHASCHQLRGMKVYRQPKALLANVAGAEVVPLEGEQECCGFGGLFAIKFPLLSEAMMERKLASIADTGASHVVGCDLSCLLHINAGLHRHGSSIKGVHIAEVLAGTVSPR
ncbi:MAG: (Fe-S)-binding protein [Chloroflexota bacterium]